MDKIHRRRGVIRATATKLIQDIISALELTPQLEGKIKETLKFFPLAEASLYKLDAEVADIMNVAKIEVEMQGGTGYEKSLSNIKARVAMLLRAGRQFTIDTAPSEKQPEAPNQRLKRTSFEWTQR